MSKPSTYTSANELIQDALSSIETLTARIDAKMDEYRTLGKPNYAHARSIIEIERQLTQVVRFAEGN